MRLGYYAYCAYLDVCLLLSGWRPQEYVAPLIGFLCSDAAEVPTGGVFEGGCGYFAELKWMRSDGVFLDLQTVDGRKAWWEAQSSIA